ncbi:PREDICTED: uncharacterized protein LOC18588237 isoform X2 [Theobroma cacao]|uniref:Uncharacterized protein LOC18588237 isoform X2 n=1 Tax=Theobroma cacao TaxID=3641 RepID=A0AB32UP55_THECC|nr:PREDICTED: uncharacterized protein LOC18588237 isoform X2 [Theobroma cacao]
MGTGDEVVEIESLERSLLSESITGEEGTEAEDESVLYTASFQEMEENFVKYQTAQWVLFSLLLILAWGIGLFMLLYIPVRRYILRKDIRSRKLYLTPNSIVYKVTRPVPFPCFGVLKKEKHVLLPSVADVVIEQGYLQSLFGVYSLRIENVGVRRPPNDDVQIQGIANPSAFRKLSPPRSKLDAIPHSGDLALLQKLEEVGSSVKRVQSLIEEQHGQTSETAD